MTMLSPAPDPETLAARIRAACTPEQLQRLQKQLKLLPKNFDLTQLAWDDILHGFEEETELARSTHTWMEVQPVYRLERVRAALAKIVGGEDLDVLEVEAVAEIPNMRRFGLTARAPSYTPAPAPVRPVRRRLRTG